MMHDRPSKVLLTTDDVAAWRLRREHLLEQIEEMQHEIKTLDKRLELVDLMFPSDEALSTSKLQQAPDKNATLQSYVKQILSDAKCGLRYQDMIDYVMQSSYRDRVVDNPNYIYNLMSKFITTGDVKRVEDTFFDVEVYNNLVKNGWDEAAFANARHIPTMSEIIQSIVEQHPNGIAAAPLLRDLRMVDGFAEKLDRNPQYGYTVLSRMVKRGELTRSGDLYVMSVKG